MRWLEVRIDTNHAGLETVQAMLSALGMDKNASVSQLLAAIADHPLDESPVTGYLATLYLGAVIAGGGSPEGVDPAEALDGLRQLLEQGDWGLAREDAAVLAALGPALGRYDSQTQVQALERQRQRLEQNLARARAEQESQGRIWRTGGLCCGAALALLIL